MYPDSRSTAGRHDPCGPVLGSMIQRQLATDEEIDIAFRVLRDAVECRILKHGRGKWVSPHEALGILTEEWKESVDAVQSNDLRQITAEMIDCAVAGLWAYVSLPPVRVPSPDGQGYVDNVLASELPPPMEPQVISEEDISGGDPQAF